MNFGTLENCRSRLKTTFNIDAKTGLAKRSSVFIDSCLSRTLNAHLLETISTKTNEKEQTIRQLTRRKKIH